VPVALVLDTGPLLAALDTADAQHIRCKQLLESSQEPLVIPAPVLVELDYWIHQRLNPAVMLTVLSDIRLGAYEVEDVTNQDLERMIDLMDRYSDSDIGFVDAAVLAIVERLHEPKLATLDRRHFGILRPRHIDSLRLLPE
jgi:predicted nucleic acid-binding protein